MFRGLCHQKGSTAQETNRHRPVPHTHASGRHGEGKGSSTHITLKRLLPGVSPLVLVQAPFLAEGFAALRALVWLFLESMERDCCERGMQLPAGAPGNKALSDGESRNIPPPSNDYKRGVGQFSVSIRPYSVSFKEELDPESWMGQKGLK